jgi:hypothetical protein
MTARVQRAGIQFINRSVLSPNGQPAEPPTLAAMPAQIVGWITDRRVLGGFMIK